MMGQTKVFIRDILFECPRCTYRISYRTTRLSKQGKVHEWICTARMKDGAQCNGALILSRDRALLAKDLSQFGRWVLNTGQVEGQLVKTKRGRIDRAKSFTKLVQYLESNPDELMILRAEYLGNRL